MFLIKIAQSDGFTMPDILVALMIGAILALISIPSLSSIGGHINLKAEHIRLEKFIQNLILESKRRGIPVKLRLKKDQYEAETLEDHPTYLGYRKLPRLISIDLKNDKFSMNFYGTGTNSPTTIILKDSKSKCSISVSLRGRVNSKCR